MRFHGLVCLLALVCVAPARPGSFDVSAAPFCFFGEAAAEATQFYAEPDAAVPGQCQAPEADEATWPGQTSSFAFRPAARCSAPSKTPEQGSAPLLLAGLGLIGAASVSKRRLGPRA